MVSQPNQMKPSSATIDVEMSGKYKATASFDMGEGQKMKLIHGPHNTLNGMEYSGKQWTVGATAAQDFFYEFRQSTDVGSMKIRQNVRAGKFSTIPSPIVALNTVARKTGKWTDSYELAYDFSTKAGKAIETLNYNGKHTLKVTADTVTGVNGAVFTGVTTSSNKFCKKIGVSTSAKTGPILLYESDPIDKVHVKADYVVMAESLITTTTVKPNDKTELRLDAKFNSKAGLFKPALALGVTTNF